MGDGERKTELGQAGGKPLLERGKSAEHPQAAFDFEQQLLRGLG